MGKRVVVGVQLLGLVVALSRRSKKPNLRVVHSLDTASVPPQQDRHGKWKWDRDERRQYASRQHVMYVLCVVCSSTTKLLHQPKCFKCHARCSVHESPKADSSAGSCDTDEYIVSARRGCDGLSCSDFEHEATIINCCGNERAVFWTNS